MNSTENKNRINTGFLEKSKNGTIAILLSILIGAMVSVMLVDYGIGINLSIFGLVLMLAVAYMMKRDDNLDFRKFAFWGTAITIYASFFFRLTNWVMYEWTFWLYPALIVLMTIFASKKQADASVGKFFYRHFAFFIHFYRFFTALAAPTSEGKKGKKTALNIIVGVGISVILLIIIIPLMLNADIMFENTMSKLFTWGNIEDVLSKVLTSTVITLLFFGFIYTITVKKDAPSKKELTKEKKQIDMNTAIITILGIIGAVFTIFAVIQFRYLFIGIDGSLPAGYTYSEYAVYGYWEQFFLTIINLAIILTCVHLSKSSAGKLRKTINIMLTCLLSLNVYLLLSAAYKMHLYQRAYGFTLQRILVYLILLFELIVFALMVVKIFKREFPFLKVAIYTAVAYFAIVSLMNLEALSAKMNINKLMKTGEIDEYYIVRSTDASKQAKELYIEHYDELTEEQRDSILRRFVGRYDGPESVTLQEYDDRYFENRSWLEFNLSEWRRYKNGKEVFEFYLNNK